MSVLSTNTTRTCFLQLGVVHHAVEEQLRLQVVVQGLGALLAVGVGGGQRQVRQGQGAVRARGRQQVHQAWVDGKRRSMVK